MAGQITNEKPSVFPNGKCSGKSLVPAAAAKILRQRLRECVLLERKISGVGGRRFSFSRFVESITESFIPEGTHLFFMKSSVYGLFVMSRSSAYYFGDPELSAMGFSLDGRRLKVIRNNPVFIYGVKPVDFPKTEIVFDFSDVLVYDLEKIAERIISGLINPEDKSQGTAWICAAAEGLRLPHERKKLYAISRAIGMNIELPTEIRENFRHFSEIWQQINRYLRGIDIIEREIQSVIDHKNRIYGVFVETNEKVYHIYLRKSADWVKFPVPKTSGFASNAKKRFIDYGSIGFIVFIQDKPE